MLLLALELKLAPPHLCLCQRWGIRDEATREHRTSEICMGEIARCAKAAEGLGPTAVFFLLLLGNRVSGTSVLVSPL